MRKLSLLLLIALFVFSCSKEEVDDSIDTSLDSKSNPVLVSTDVLTDTSTFDFVESIYGNTHRAYNRGEVELGFIVKENSQNPGRVYLRTGANEWTRINEARSSSIAGFWDTLSKNNSEDARIMQPGNNSNQIFVFFGNNGRNYKMFRVDNGEVLKAHNQPTRTLPSGFVAGRLFYHDSDRADFPANWLGVKGKRVWNFGSDLRNSTPSLMIIRQNGFNGANLNKDISKIKGYWPLNNQRIILDRTGNRSDVTIQKERKNGVNYYKS
ncbi:MAG: hypothetical protein Wins2KO_00150 [Winogradskyella sp.]